MKPKIFHHIKKYDLNTFIGDLKGGAITAIVALPLSIALSIASNCGPNEGIYAAIVAGFVVALLGGSSVNVTGPTAALSTTVAAIVLNDGMPGLIASSIIAGIFLLAFSAFKLGKYIIKIPAPIVTGFTSGIGITIFLGQIKDFFGMTYVNGAKPITGAEKLIACLQSFSTFNVIAFLIGLISLLLLILIPKIIKKIPESLIVLIVMTALVALMNIKVNRLSDLYNVTSDIMTFHKPDFSYFGKLNTYINGFMIALITSITSLLACVVQDKMISEEHAHHPDMELAAQGVGSVASVLFGGIPTTGAIARSIAGIKNGSKTPVAAMIHAIVLFLVLLFLMPLVKLIPMATIAALLFIVAYNSSQLIPIINYSKSGNVKNILCLFLCIFFTVLFNPVVGIIFSLPVYLIITKVLKK